MPSTLLGQQAHTAQRILSPLLLHVLTPPRAETPHPLAADLLRGGRGLESGRTKDVLPGSLTGLALFCGAVSCYMKSLILLRVMCFQVTPQALAIPSGIFLKETQSSCVWAPTEDKNLTLASQHLGRKSCRLSRSLQNMDKKAVPAHD